MAKHILVVDDDHYTTTLVRLILERFGYRVTEVHSAEAALDRIAHAVPDLFIIDIMMPGIDGYELCRQLRAYGPTSETPILMFSAAESHLAQERSARAGANAYLPKSGSPHILASYVSTLLNGDSTRAVT